MSGSRATIFPSADVCALAIVAAAGVLGDDPVAACEGRISRRAVVVAGAALARLSGVPAMSVGRVLRVDNAQLSRAVSAGAPPTWTRAIKAAVNAAVEPFRLQVMRTPPAPAADQPPPPQRTTPVVLTAGAVARQALARLQEAPATAPDLARAIGVGEAQVREALAALAERGAALADALTAEGWRLQFWRAVNQAEGDRP